MRFQLLKRLTYLLLVLILSSLIIPFSTVRASANTVSIGILPGNTSSANEPVGSSFVVNLNVSGVTNLCGWQLDLSYNQTVIQVSGTEGGTGVTAGLSGNTVMPVDTWAFQPAFTPGGTIRILGHFPNITGATGSGYLAQVHFNVVGPSFTSSSLHLANVMLFDNQTAQITPVITGDGLVSVSNFHILNSSPLADGEVSAPYSQNLTAAEGTPPYTWSIQSGTLPAALSLNATSGVITGIPAAAFGPATITFKVTDSAARTSSKDLSLKIIAAPVITTLSLAPCEVGMAYSQALSVSGGTPPYVWSTASGALPPGLSLTPTGNITGTPAAPGNFSVTFTVTDSFRTAVSATKPLNMTMFPRGDASGDLIVNMADVIKVERIILSMDAPTPGKDPTRDGVVNMADVTMIERIILGLPTN